MPSIAAQSCRAKAESCHVYAGDHEVTGCHSQEHKAAVSRSHSALAQP